MGMCCGGWRCGKRSAIGKAIVFAWLDARKTRTSLDDAGCVLLRRPADVAWKKVSKARSKMTRRCRSVEPNEAVLPNSLSYFTLAIWPDVTVNLFVACQRCLPCWLNSQRMPAHDVPSSRRETAVFIGRLSGVTAFHRPVTPSQPAKRPMRHRLRSWRIRPPARRHRAPSSRMPATRLPARRPK